MFVRTLRLQRGWSQEQLAELSGLSARTIQRIERGKPAGLETRKSLAAVFEIPLTELTEATTVTTATHETDHLQKQQTTEQEQQALEYVRDLKSFYTNLATYAVVIPFLFGINYLSSPDYYWAWWPALGWGLGMVIQGITTFEMFNLLGANWEKKALEKRLGKKL